MEKCDIIFSRHSNSSIEELDRSLGGVSTLGAYIVASPSGKSEKGERYTAYNSYTTCRDSFFNKVHSLFQDGVQEVTVFLNGPESLSYNTLFPKWIAYYDYTNAEPTKEVVSFYGKRTGIRFILKRKMYPGPLVFWIATEEFRKNNFRNFSLADKSWYDTFEYKRMKDTLSRFVPQEGEITGGEIQRYNSPYDYYNKVISSLELLNRFIRATISTKPEDATYWGNSALLEIKKMVALHPQTIGMTLFGGVSLKELQDTFTTICAGGLKYAAPRC